MEAKRVKGSRERGNVGDGNMKEERRREFCGNNFFCLYNYNYRISRLYSETSL